MRLTSYFLSLSLVTVTAGAQAQTSDPAAAHAHLQEGYKLKQQGSCDQAIPRFVESIRLDRQPKALLNLGDCEEKVGRLAAAQVHFAEARDLASAQGLAPERTLAEQRRQSLEKRIPKLVIKLATRAPPNVVVTRDGVVLGAVSLGTALPIDPGTHIIVARAGQAEVKYRVTLREGETREIEVSPGEIDSKLSTPTAQAAAPSNVGGARTTAQADDQASSQAGDGSTPVVATLVAAGVGVAGLTVGTIFGLQSNSKNKEASSACPEAGCSEAEHANFDALRDDAKQARTISVIGFAAAGVAAVTVAVLLMTAPAPAPRKTARKLSVDAWTTAESSGVLLRGNW